MQAGVLGREMLMTLGPYAGGAFYGAGRPR